jgi:hypothetical protein
MSRGCPNCGYLFIRAAFRRSGGPYVPWYRLAPPQLYCPKCHTRVHSDTTLAGHIINAAMALACATYILWLFAHPALLTGAWYAPLGLFPVVLPFVIAYWMWGRKYSTGR